MEKISPRERLIRSFRCLPVDRMPIRIWGVDPLFPREDWRPLYRLVEKYELEIIRDWRPKQEEAIKVYEEKQIERESTKKELKEIERIINTPKGALKQIFLQPRDGSPGRVKKYFIEERKDAEKWLSLPSPTSFPKIDSYWELEKITKDRAMLMIGLAEAMYAVQVFLGSETFSYWLYDERELLHRMIEKSYQEIENLVKHYLSFKIGDSYGWVGPELCIPPLTSVKDFHEFVFDYDKRIIEIIHQEGKLVWVHCHGDMKPVLKEFIEMGVDCLNPIEPPPVSKISLKEIKRISQGKMALDGGIEDGAFDLLKPEGMKKVVEETILQLKDGYGFILSPTSSPNTWPTPLPRHIENYKAFIETAVRLKDY